MGPRVLLAPHLPRAHAHSRPPSDHRARQARVSRPRHLRALATLHHAANQRGVALPVRPPQLPAWYLPSVQQLCGAFAPRLAIPMCCLFPHHAALQLAGAHRSAVRHMAAAPGLPRRRGGPPPRRRLPRGLGIEASEQAQHVLQLQRSRGGNIDAGHGGDVLDTPHGLLLLPGSPGRLCRRAASCAPPPRAADPRLECDDAVAGVLIPPYHQLAVAQATPRDVGLDLMDGLELAAAALHRRYHGWCKR